MEPLISRKSRSSISQPVTPRSSSKPRRSSPLSQPDSTMTAAQTKFGTGSFTTTSHRLISPPDSSHPQPSPPNRSRERLFAPPVEVEPPPEADSKHKKLQFEFNSEKQFHRLCIHGLKWFLVTLCLAIVLVGTIKGFSRKQVMSYKKKLWFNALSTGLSMALGISVASGFKRMVVDLRWFILSRRPRSMFEVSMVINLLPATQTYMFSSYIGRQNTLRR